MTLLGIGILLLMGSGQEQAVPAFQSKTLTAIKADFYRANCEYLIFQSHPAKDVANPALKSYAETRHAEWIDEARKMQKELGKPIAAWELEIAMHVEYATPKIVTVGVSNYNYSGGAHPNHGVDMMTFGKIMAKPSRLTLGDFFAPGFDYADHVSKLVIGKLAGAEGADWVKSGEVQKLDSKMLQRFAPQKDGIVWFFNPYDVGPYAAGDFEVKLTLAELGPSFKATLLK